MATNGETPAPDVAAQEVHHFFVTRDSQDINKKKPESRKLSYVGMRNLSDLEKIDEQDIVSSRGTIRGMKNRVRAGLANFENPKALEKVSVGSLTVKGDRGGRGSHRAKHRGAREYNNYGIYW